MGKLQVTTLSVMAVFAGISTASATDGYFQTGYGQKVVAMGGASAGLVTGAMGGADNPASIAFSGDTISLNGSYFVPHRSAARSGNAYGLNGSATSKDDNFLIPGFGFNGHINDRLAYGITAYGNGGLNTDFPGGTLRCFSPQNDGGYPGNLLCGSGHLGVNLIQLIIAPTLAYKVTPNFAVAVSPQIIYQQFEARGLQPFQYASNDPGAVTNRGGDGSFGIGVKLGFFWRATPRLSIGGFYSPKSDNQKFKKYAGLFAGGGSFDLPETFSIGLGYKATPRLTLAADFQRIFYANVPSVGNPSSNRAPLGAADGPGFGWRNINVYKFGMAYRLNQRLTIRAGFNHSDDPVTSGNVTFNILAPGVITNQLSGGLTFHVTPKTDVTVTYLHGFAQTVTGPTSPLLPGGGTDRISLEENMIGIGILHKI